MSTVATTAELPAEHPAARSARVRRDAADRARRWRETQRETDAALVQAMLVNVDAFVTADHRLHGKESHVDIADVVGRAAYILGGRPRFKEAKARVFARLRERAPAPKGNA